MPFSDRQRSTIRSWVSAIVLSFAVAESTGSRDILPPPFLAASIPCLGFTEASESELFDRKVKSDEEAYELYNSYAFKHSFGIRKDKLNRREDKVTIRQRFFVCSFAGFKQEKKPGEEPKVYQKRNFCTGCKAHIQFDVDKNYGLFVVVNHTMDHNHSRVPVSKRHLIRSHRKVTEEQIAMLSSLTESSIPVADAVRVLKHQACGEANLSFLCSDAYGALSAHKKMKFDGSRVIGMQPPLYEYHVGHPKKDLLMHQLSRLIVCNYFGEVGLLCKHSLCVLHLNNVTYILKRYICKRWTKGAMCTRVDDNVVAEKGVTPSSVWRLHFIRTFIGLVDRAQNDLAARTTIEEAITECSNRINLLQLKDKDEPCSSTTNQHEVAPDNGEGNLVEPQNFEEEVLEKEDIVEEEPAFDVEVKDPIQKRKKGQKNTRLKSTQEKICNKLKGQKIKSWNKKSTKGV
uniref:FAR1 domain-containing protein n=1 Tax=Chenopodium quinoa TaxID=63459 RepID=A0A803N2J0_CHEQI